MAGILPGLRQKGMFLDTNYMDIQLFFFNPQVKFKKKMETKRTFMDKLT